MKIGYLREDSDGHQYVIPEELIKDFNLIEEEFSKAEEYSDEYYDLCGEFSDLFDDYRIEGELYNMKIIMEE